MYIEYITPQQAADKNLADYKSTGGDYRPTWLVRTSDWKKVPGYEAVSGYHTLSYVWEQSGEMFPKEDGEYGLTDNGHHQITVTVLKKVKGRRSVGHREVTQATNVKYNALLKKVCKDFGIQYLWYDKICIDQNNKEEKHREIKQMHLIYSNARFTLAMVPEINIGDPGMFERTSWNGSTEAKSKAIDQIQYSLWWQRSWTLEELMMSSHILVVGRNTHFWSLTNTKADVTRTDDDILGNFILGFNSRKFKSINQVLMYAHFRTSTKKHDKIYALANILHDVVDVDINYDIDLKTVMKGFYRKLGEHDLSIMCFGTALLLNGVPRFARNTMSDYGLPSWTGVGGLHSCRPVTEVALDDHGSGYHIDQELHLHLKCRSLAIQPIKYESFVFIQEEHRLKAESKYVEQVTSMDEFDDEQAAIYWSQFTFQSDADCLPTHCWKPSNFTSGFRSPVTSLSLTEMCDTCTVLAAVFTIAVEHLDDYQSDGFAYHYFSPVVKENADESSHRVIGLIQLRHFQKDDEDRPSPQEVMDQIFDELNCEVRDFCIT